MGRTSTIESGQELHLPAGVVHEQHLPLIVV
jgi:hypothetical protein